MDGGAEVVVVRGRWGQRLTSPASRLRVLGTTLCCCYKEGVEAAFGLVSVGVWWCGRKRHEFKVREEFMVLGLEEVCRERDKERFLGPS